MLDHLVGIETEQRGGRQRTAIERQLRPDLEQHIVAGRDFNARLLERRRNGVEPVAHHAVEFAHKGHADAGLFDMPRPHQRPAVIGDTSQHFILAHNRGDAGCIAPTILQRKHGRLVTDHR